MKKSLRMSFDFISMWLSRINFKSFIGQVWEIHKCTFLSQGKKKSFLYFQSIESIAGNGVGRVQDLKFLLPISFSQFFYRI